MASEISMALEELVCKAQLSDDVDFLREGVRALPQAPDGSRSDPACRRRSLRTDRWAHGGTQWHARPALGYAGGQHHAASATGP